MVNSLHVLIKSLSFTVELYILLLCFKYFFIKAAGVKESREFSWAICFLVWLQLGSVSGPSGTPFSARTAPLLLSVTLRFDDITSDHLCIIYLSPMYYMFMSRGPSTENKRHPKKRINSERPIIS